MIFARKINKIPEFHMTFARKMPEFYIAIAPKYLNGSRTHDLSITSRALYHYTTEPPGWPMSVEVPHCGSNPIPRSSYYNSKIFSTAVLTLNLDLDLSNVNR